MSKMDGLRAMREAKYAAAQRASSPGARPAAPRTTPGPAAERAAASGQASAETSADAALCGHRNMGGRTCTREKDHAAKSHRYS